MGKYDDLFILNKTASIELMDVDDVADFIDPTQGTTPVNLDDIPGVKAVRKIPSAVVNMGNSLATVAGAAGRLPVAAGEVILDASGQLVDATASGFKNAYKAVAGTVSSAAPYIAGGVGATGAGILALSKANDLTRPKPPVPGGISGKAALKALLAMMLAGGAHSLYQNYQDRAKAKQELSNNA